VAVLLVILLTAESRWSNDVEPSSSDSERERFERGAGLSASLSPNIGLL